MSKKLLIVESPTKAKTIKKFLGSDYEVLSSFGHVRDLPKKSTAVDVKNGFTPTYEVPPKAKPHVDELKRAAKKADEIYLATDEDREGEAIAWHVAELLGLDETAKNRIAFHEITQHAVEEAIRTPRSLDMHLVEAQQARRILDRLVGYELSPFLWEKVQRGLSAGRVQSVAVRLIVERERERLAFKVDEYWTIDAEFEKDAVVFPGKLFAVDGKRLDKLALGSEAEAKAITGDLAGAAFTVSDITTKEVKKSPPAPLTTSALQIEANNKLGYSAKQTMQLAQKLYETGRITYMRTDSLNLSEKFLGEAQAYISASFGAAYATGSKTYVTKKKGAQEAHEAIRPTDAAVTPDALPKTVDAQTRKLYDLIWRRTLASQMPAAVLERTAADIAAKRYAFRANGSTIRFDGFMKVYRAAQEKILPALANGDAVAAKAIVPNQHFTEPVPRYSDATLVKALEEYGIGRPSTYAPTIGTIIDRGYIDRDDNKKFFPTDIANIVTDVLIEHFPQIVDYEFTATLERSLDEIAEGQVEGAPMLEAFYGPFHAAIEEKSKSLKRSDVMKERLIGTDPESGLPVIVRSGRFGPFIQLGEWSEEDKKAKRNKPKSASLEKGQSMDTIALEDAMKLLVLPRTVGQDETGMDIIADKGRFGPYLKAGERTASIPEDQDPKTITLEDARALLANAAERKKKMETPVAELGEDPASKKPIQVRFGRYGYYVTDSVTNASVRKDTNPASVTREQAIELLEQKRKAPKRNWGKKK